MLCRVRQEADAGDVRRSIDNGEDAELFRHKVSPGTSVQHVLQLTTDRSRKGSCHTRRLRLHAGSVLYA